MQRAGIGQLKVYHGNPNTIVAGTCQFIPELTAKGERVGKYSTDRVDIQEKLEALGYQDVLRPPSPDGGEVDFSDEPEATYELQAGDWLMFQKWKSNYHFDDPKSGKRFEGMFLGKIIAGFNLPKPDAKTSLDQRAEYILKYLESSPTQRTISAGEKALYDDYCTQRRVPETPSDN